MRTILVARSLLALVASLADARVVRLRIERRELMLNGRPFGAAGPYEKLVGKVDFALDPTLPRNGDIVDLKLAPRNARGEVEASADFYMLKPVDPAPRQRTAVLRGRQPRRQGDARRRSRRPPARPIRRPRREFGDGALMRQGFTLLWMGWQWDVPERPGTMRMEMPIATENGQPITGLVRGNFILNERADTASVADRDHKAYPVLDPNSAEQRDDRARRSRPRRDRSSRDARWRFVDGGTVALDGGFEPGRIYDVVYRTADPRVLGFGLAGTRDLVSFLKYDTSTGQPDRRACASRSAGACRRADGSCVTSSIRASTRTSRGASVFDGVFDQVGGAGRGSFNHRFGQASRDALQHFNILFPGRSVSVHRRAVDRSGDRHDRQPARARRDAPARRRRSSTC